MGQSMVENVKIENSNATFFINFGDFEKLNLAVKQCYQICDIKTYRKSKIREAKYQERSTFLDLIRTWPRIQKGEFARCSVEVFGLWTSTAFCELLSR